MKLMGIVLFALMHGIGVQAQNAEDSVKTVVRNLFTAMRQSDAALLQSVFADSAILQTIHITKSGERQIRNEAVANFAKQVAAAPMGALDERITIEAVKIDADLASVWTPYTFYYNGKLSHCGANSFQLVRINKVWKIQYLIDTRRRDKCE